MTTLQVTVARARSCPRPRNRSSGVRSSTPTAWMRRLKTLRRWPRPPHRSILLLHRRPPTPARRRLQPSLRTPRTWPSRDEEAACICSSNQRASARSIFGSRPATRVSRFTSPSTTRPLEVLVQAAVGQLSQNLEGRGLSVAHLLVDLATGQGG